MAPSLKQAVNSGTVLWISTHLDNILVHELNKLIEQELKQERAISNARNDQNYSHNNEKDLLTEYVMGEWLEGVIFKKDGQRCIIEKDIDLRSCKSALFSWYRLQIDVKHRHYYIKPYRTLEQVDRTGKKKTALRKSVGVYQHKSEKGWFLPQTDPHHLLKFPLDIIDKILGYVVQAPGAAIAPSVVTCNWKKFWVGAPSFTIHTDIMPRLMGNGKQEYPEPHKSNVIPTLTEDEDGSLKVLRRVHEAEIDASIVRVCKSFNNIAANLLYGRNHYTFRMNNSTLGGSPPTWIGKESWYPPAEKPFTKDYNRSTNSFRKRIRRGLTDIRKHVTIKNLAGWVFHDPFLRFLYTIGPRNAALIRTLKFSGEVRCHQCESGHFCENCILDSLRVYIPFINTFCPNVHKLILSIHGHHNKVEEAAIFNQKVPQFFGGDLRCLENVRDLVVIDIPPDSSNIVQTAASRIAEPTINYFRRRYAEWANDYTVTRQ
ncbi:hypothetical protein EAF04_010447 [Stromatinia cepivora]|nr:hypothetical protein EAF04_010447 [Stromatinia cepivora]